MKKGISLVALVVTMVIMIILMSAVTVGGFATLNNSNKIMFATEINMVEKALKNYMNENNSQYPVTDEVQLNITGVSASARLQFESEIVNEGNVNLFKIDYSKLGITSLKYGTGANGGDLDSYMVSKTTGRVYYAKGLKVGSSVYYTLTEDLKALINLDNTLVSSEDIIFNVSETKWTNSDVVTKVKVPKEYEQVEVTVNGSNIYTGETLASEPYVLYTISNMTSNYLIKVAYEKDGKKLEKTYSVNNVDKVPPLIDTDKIKETIVNDGDKKVIKINMSYVRDELSGIKQIKYAPIYVEGNSDEISSYFKSNGYVVYDKLVEVDSTVKYLTFFVEDNAGNFSAMYYSVSNSSEDERKVPSLYRFYVSEPLYSGNYVAGQKIVVLAQFDKNVYNSEGQTISVNNVSFMPKMTIRFGNGEIRNVNPVYVGENSEQISSDTIKGSLVRYEYTIQESDYGELSLVNYAGNVYNEKGESAYITANTLGERKIVATGPFCKIGTQNYGGVQEAINHIDADLNSTTTIDLIADNSSISTYTIPSNKDVTINLNGFSLESNTMTILNEGKLTINGNGSISSESTASPTIRNNGTLIANNVNISSGGIGITTYGQKFNISNSKISSSGIGVNAINTNNISNNFVIERVEFDVTSTSSNKTAISLKDINGTISNIVSNGRIYNENTLGNLSDSKTLFLNRNEINVDSENAIYNEKGILNITEGIYKSTSNTGIYNNQGSILLYNPNIQGNEWSIYSNQADTFINDGTFKSKLGNNIKIEGGNLIINKITEFDTPSSSTDINLISPAKAYIYKNVTCTKSGDGQYITQDEITNEPVY